MIFKVERSSEWSDDVQPIKEAYKGKCIETECFLFPSFEAFEERNNCSFKAIGTNHRVLPDKTIARDFEVERYLIEINTLEDLMKLEKKYGDIIIRHYSYNYPVLEIYDTWRE
ncbi:MAG: hypothetical protein E7F47_01820 [Peptoniphilus harei]|nr:hypothetical protein [Peptoniphilus harei]